MNKDNVWKSTLEYFDGDDLATQVWMDKYALHNKKGEILEESPLQMHERIAREFSRIEEKYDNPLSYNTIFNLLDEFKYFIPAGSVMFGCGNPYTYSSLANCFVIGNGFDTYSGIIKNDEELAQIMKRRGGVGLDLSHLRPAKAQVNNAAKTSTGAVSFMPRYSYTTREVAQDGRRGALMLTLNISHPDVEEFIDAKADTSQITGANISLKITDSFMKAVEEDTTFETTFQFSTRDRTVRSVSKFISAKKIWDKIISNAWETAEPGVLFWDQIIHESPADSYKGFDTISTNPCGEVPLALYDSCRLGHVNLYSFVVNPFMKTAFFDSKKFRLVAKQAQRLMDDLIDLEEEKINQILDKIDSDPEPPLEKLVETQLWNKVLNKLTEGRRTGLGVVGLGDCLAAVGLTYGTPDATDFAEEIMKTFAISSYESSIIMARERGPFLRFDIRGDFNSDFTKRMAEQVSPKFKSMWEETGRRNIANLALAPTGSTSLLTQTTSGIEPLFQRSYKRRRKVETGDPDANITFVDDSGDSWEEYEVFHHKWQVCQDVLMEQDPKRYFEGKGPYAGAASNEIDPLEKVKMQGKLQKWIDHSISVTHNLPKSATKEDVSNIYLNAWKYGCKGVTIYREGSRDGVLIKNKDNRDLQFPQVHSPKRDRTLPCDIFYPTIKGTQFIVLVGLLSQKPYEIFAFRQNGIRLSRGFTTGFITKIKRGVYNLLDSNKEIVVEDITSKFELPVEEFATRMVSTALRHGTPVSFVVDQLDKAPAETLHDYNKVVARVLKKYIVDGKKVSGHTCPECQSDNLIYESGCIMCAQCGNSKC